jgi:poly-beta-1,6-N-acetyl-D-glucosamine synthase
VNSQKQALESATAESIVCPRTFDPSYVLMTAAYNEEAHIEATISSVLAQSLLPLKWVIVSDGSTDGTDEIVNRYVIDHRFISLVRVARKPSHNFGAKVRALHRASEEFAGLAYGFIGNIDADLRVEPEFFKTLVTRFEADPKLGLAGGFVYEEENGEYKSRSKNSERSVPHAAQLVRRECYEAIGGYAVLKHGGEDWHAQISANIKGWQTVAFRDLKIFHRRHSATSGGSVRSLFRQGRMDYCLGSYPPFEFIKCLTRTFYRPFLVGAAARLTGFIWSYLSGEHRPVSAEFVTFLRNEQKNRMVLIRNGRKRRDRPGDEER